MDIEKLNKLKPRNRNSTNAARNKLTTKKTKFVLCAQPSDKNNNLERLNSKLNSNFIQKLSLNQADEDNEISQIESFVFNEDEPQNVQELDEDNNDDDDDDEDDDDEDDEDDDDDGLNLLKNRPKTYAQIDNDTKLKLETLLANAGIESITSDLFKDPQIMQTLTTTYVRTLNEVVAKTKLKKSVSKSKSETKTINEVVESTFEEFILAAAAVAAASSSSNSTMSNNGDEDDDELTEADIQHHNYMIQKLDKSDKKSDSKSDKKSVTSSASSSSSSLKQTINSCIGNLTSPESLLNKLIDLKPDLANSDKEAIDALTQVANKKIAVGKSLTELLEENADSVLGLACASGYLELVSVLLAINSNSNLDTVSKSKIKNESTPLIEACSNGHEQIVELLLKHGANPNKKSSSGSSPLHYAIQNQHANIVKKLAETCKDAILIEQTNENGHTPLMEAASNGFLDCAKILVDIGQANVNTYSAEFKETALTLASYKGHVEVVKYLLEKGADCEHKTDEMHTALMEACMDGHIEVAKVLIEHGANVNMPADSFESPLTLAACGGHVELADLLIDNHADLEERNDEGYTPLMEAAREGHEEMVALLLFHDADINAITDETQETALTLACCGGCYEVAKFLLEAGADPNLGNASTPLMEAAQEGHLELVQLLIKAGADVNKFYTALITNGQNTTQNITSCESALSLACENGHTDVAAALIKAGAEADMADPDKGFTPLMKAARSGQLCTVQYLIGNCSVDVNRTTKNNESTALSLASSNGHIQLIELLLQHGANPLYVLKDNSNCLIEASKNGHVKIVELLIDWNYSLNEMDEAKKTKRKNLKINLKPKMTSQTHVHTGDQTLSPSSLSPSSSLVKQIRKSVTKLDTTSELGVENLVNVLHHFAFGDMTPSESKAKKKRNKDDISLVSIEEFCECKCQGNCNTEVMTADNDKLLHLSLSIGSQIDRGAEDEDDDDDDDQEDDDDDEGQGQGQGHTECDQERMNDEERVSSGGGGGGEGGGLGEQDEDEQIKKKENLLQELLKIEKQLEVQRKSKVKSHNSNYDHMSMINKYLIKRCQCELNRLYKIKLKQLQEQKINEIKADSKISKKCIAKKCGATTTSTTISTNNSTTTSTTTTTITNNTNNISNSSTPKSTTSDEWLPPPPPPFAAAAAYLIQQSMKSKASEQNAPHIDLDMATETNNDTALTVAVQGAHEDLVKLLIEKGAHIEHKDKKGYTPLILAASVGHHRIVQLLLVYGANVEAQSERNKDTALCVAAQNGKYECCEILLSKGQANKEHRNISDYTPLSLAASNGYVNIIKLLLSHGAEINSRTGSKLGISPLMLAAMNGHTHAVRFLIEAGSDVNSQIETNRNTALTLACFQGRADVVTLLLDKKANIEHRAKTGLTPLMEAASGGYDQVGRILLERGADENALPVPTTKDTALTIAAEKGHVKFVELLVQYGAHLEAKNKKGCSALWLACHAGHFDVVQTLVLNNADADSCDSRRTSCLVAAFKRGHLNICKFLVRHVKHFAPDQELTRHINSLLSTPDHDKQLAKKCHECMDVILKAKDKQAQEANKYASLLLKQLDQEKCREQSKKMAAQRKREKKKLKKKQIKHLELDQDQPQDQLQEQLQEQLQDQDEDELTKQQHKDHLSTAAPCDSAKVQQHQQQQKEHQKEQEQEEQKEEEQEEQAIVASAKVVVKAEQQQQRKKKKKSSSQMHKKSSKLADLDDFEVCKQQQQQQHLASGATSTTSTNTTKLNDLDAFDLNDLSNFKQRVLLPSNRIDRITAMCTKSLSNIQVIQNLTKCTLKMEQVRLKSSVDKYVVVAGASLDQTKYACELLETLINDPLVNLANLLPSCSETEWSVGPPVAASKPKHKTPAAALHKPNTAHNTAPVPPHTNDVKPRNFAEAVAKPVNWTRRHSVSPAKPDKKMDKPVQIVVPIGKQDNEPAVKHPGAPPSAPLPAKIEFASVGQHDQAYQPLISNKVIDQVLSDILSPSFSQVNNKPLSSPSLNLNEPMLTRPTKPIGYERHEKQFRNSNQNLDHNHANVNQNNWMVNNSMDLLSSFNHQMLFSSQMSMVPNSQQAQFNPGQFNPGQFNPGMYQNFHKPVTPPMPIGHINPAMINYTGSYANFPANQAPLIQHNHMFNPSASLMPHSIQNAPNQQQSLIDSFFFSSKSTGFNFNNF